MDSSRKKSFAHLIVPFKHRNVQSLVLVSNGLYNFSSTSYMYPEVISSFIYVCIFSYFLSCLPFMSTSMLLAETFEELFCHLGRGRQRTNFNEVIPMWLCSLVSLLQTIFFTPPFLSLPTLDTLFGLFFPKYAKNSLTYSLSITPSDESPFPAGSAKLSFLALSLRCDIAYITTSFLSRLIST